LEERPLTVYGDGRQSRCFMHVQDAVAAILALAENPEAVGQVFNIGSTEEVSIRALAERVLAQAGAEGSEGRIALVPYEQAYAAGFEDMRRRVPDIGRLQELTGWKPQRSLDKILADTTEHMRSRALAAVPGEGARDSG
ncbi:MAG: GDP-mannose 4,6-dehydratase, partial [Acidobacteriota bacterium]